MSVERLVFCSCCLSWSVFCAQMEKEHGVRFIENAAGLQSQAALELSAFQDALTAEPPATLAVETQAMQCTALRPKHTNSISLRLRARHKTRTACFPHACIAPVCVRACVRARARVCVVDVEGGEICCLRVGSVYVHARCTCKYPSCRLCTTSTCRVSIARSCVR
jgi:hypothetical protein